MFNFAGICRKVKLVYFLVGHGHCDGDQAIGVAGGKIANENMPTFEVFRDILRGAASGTGDKEEEKGKWSDVDVERYFYCHMISLIVY